MEHEIVLVQVPSSAAYISVVRHAVAGIALRMSFTRQEVSDIQLAVGEACNNAVKHGVECGHPVKVRCRICDSNLRVEITNRYCGERPCRPIGSKPEPHQYNEGGMGVYLMKRLVDSVQFRWGKSSATVCLTKNVRH
ncbi:MAG: ATP-binding protein [Armatimonadota bacterium]|nr:ATP-binding protein [Armatimonadota bacterium]